jgi:hypothetical protein
MPLRQRIREDVVGEGTHASHGTWSSWPEQGVLGGVDQDVDHLPGA